MGNFVLAGTGVLCLAIAVRRTITDGVGRRWLAPLIALFGLGLVASGVFVMDPENGFPIGTPDGPAPAMSWHGIAHIVAATVAFTGLPAACIVLTVRMIRRRAGWAAVLNACAALVFLAPVAPAWASIQVAVNGLVAFGLLALMLLSDARRLARSTEAGDLVRMEHQQRDLWDGTLTAEGTALITAAMRRRQVGPYQLQAAIAALHNGAPSYAETDWPQIAALYALLEQLTPTPPVRLSRAVAVAMAYGPRRGLMLLDSLADDPLIRQRERAVRAHLLELNGETQQAAELYREAAALTFNLAERRYLEGRAQDLES